MPPPPRSRDRGRGSSDVTNNEIHIIEAPGLNAYSATLLVASLAMGCIVVMSPFLVGSSSLVTLAILAGTSFVTRYIYLRRSRVHTSAQAWTAAKMHRESPPDIGQLPAAYFTYVLGSGGHTSELCKMIRQQFRGHMNVHRRYVISSGDNYSLNEVLKLESQVEIAYPHGSGGTYDVVRVRRARDIYQPLWTAWYTSLLSVISILNTMTLAPLERRTGAERDLFKHPHLVVTNGPGTGFIICLVASLMKFCFLIPNNRARLMYIETWAHTQTLSLTGKLFHLTDLADIFLVQHEALARKTGRNCVGDASQQGNLLGIKE